MSESSMSDPSSSEPLKATVWDRKLADNPNQRCTAHRKNGQRCRKFAIAGSNVCRNHGGAAKQVRNAARARLANAADRLARELLKMATDNNVSDSVKLAAIRDALDRGGVGAKTEIELTAKPYESILAGIESGSRTEFRRSQGIDDERPPAPAEHQPALDAADNDELIDAEVLDTELEGLSVSMRRQYDDRQPPTPDSEEHAPGEPWGDDSSPFAVSGPPVDAGMMTLEDAVAGAAKMRRAIARMPAQRALPPGHSI